MQNWFWGPSVSSLLKDGFYWICLDSDCEGFCRILALLITININCPKSDTQIPLMKPCKLSLTLSKLPNGNSLLLLHLAAQS